MVLARAVLLLSALPFVGIGVAFLVGPETMAARVGVSLSGTIADNDVRAVYGGLQLGCGAFLAVCAARPPWAAPGLAALGLLFGGLFVARLVSLVLVGAPGALGLLLHAAEGVGLAAAGLASLALRRERSLPGA